jgi:hypothetical protein
MPLLGAFQRDGDVTLKWSQLFSTGLPARVILIRALSEWRVTRPECAVTSQNAVS